MTVPEPEQGDVEAIKPAIERARFGNRQHHHCCPDCGEFCWPLRAEATELRAALERVERERNTLLAAMQAEPPDDKAVRYFQRLHGLPEIGLVGVERELQLRAEKAERERDQNWARAEQAEHALAAALYSLALPSAPRTPSDES